MLGFMSMPTASESRSPIDPAAAIRRVYVAEDCVDLPYTRKILARLRNSPAKVLPIKELEHFSSLRDPKAFGRGKNTLVLERQKGKFVKSCPGTKEYECCGYQVLNVGTNCPMDCVYCILQAYLNKPWLTFYVNVEDLLAELNECFAREPKRQWRIGTGEFTDSLAMDRLTCLSEVLVNFMSDKPQAVLELKTKSAVIDNLLTLPHNGHTIVSWSLNSPPIAEREELHTASLRQRLSAASCCVEAGYRVGFHFDPIIYHHGWREGYAETIEQLFTVIPAEHIAWISMGCLRFLPSLKGIAAERFPGSAFFHEEFIEGLDGKSRYFRKLRVEMYRFLAERILAFAPDICLYLCMESEEIWREVFGFSPAERGGLAGMLDRAVFTNY
jgi:spore photoproduct lyase